MQSPTLLCVVEASCSGRLVDLLSSWKLLSKKNAWNKLCWRPPQYAPAPCKLTFDLLKLKVVSESRVTWDSSVPILISLASDRRKTSDRQTSDAHHRWMPPPRGIQSMSMDDHTNSLRRGWVWDWIQCSVISANRHGWVNSTRYIDWRIVSKRTVDQYETSDNCMCLPISWKAYYAPPGDDAVWRLTSVCLTSVWRLSVCLSRTSGLNREQRGIERLKLAQR